MGTKGEMRAIAAAWRRQQREAKKRQREFARMAKEMAKLTALERARLEVETDENALEVLLSVHKEPADPWDWVALAASLPPAAPCRHSYNELKVRRRLAVSVSQNTAEAIRQAQQQDERAYQDALHAYSAEYADWERHFNLANRILNGDAGAYIDAIQELSPFGELASIGSSLEFTVHNARTIECLLRTNGRKAIPSEVKSLTASGKVSVKQMPRQRFVEIYQDYVCGCVLRVAREIFALLPVDKLLVTAAAEALDTSTGHSVERPFLSVAISREELEKLNFDALDPSDSIMSFTHRGDLKASRKTGEFEFISPLTLADLPQETIESTDPFALLATARRLRAELVQQCAAVNPQVHDVLSTNGES